MATLGGNLLDVGSEYIDNIAQQNKKNEYIYPDGLDTTLSI